MRIPSRKDIRQYCAEDLSAAAQIDRLVAEVRAFTGETPLEDDMTVVALAVET